MGRSFHSWQATSHALQPMQVEVSMSFETAGSERRPVPLPQTEAEERRISRFWYAMAASSRLLDLHEEGLELRRPGVRVDGRRASGSSRAARRGRGFPRSPSGSGSRSARPACRPPSRGGCAWSPSPCAVIEPRGARDLDHRAVRDPLLLREVLGDLEEEVGLHLVQPRVVLGPVVEVLGEAVRRADDRELLRLAVVVLVRREPLG